MTALASRPASTILIDRADGVRAHALGPVGDLALGAAIDRLVSES